MHNNGERFADILPEPRNGENCCQKQTGYKVQFLSKNMCTTSAKTATECALYDSCCMFDQLEQLKLPINVIRTLDLKA